MAISTYSELQTAVANWLDRDDLTSRVPEFIAIAEARIARKVRCRAMEERATTTVDSEFVDLPSSVIEVTDVQLNTSPKAPLRFLPAYQMDRVVQDTTAGQPKFYSIKGDAIQIRPVPDQSYEMEIIYWSRLDAFSADDDTNWLLTNHPDIYFYASLAEAHYYQQNHQMGDMYVARFTELVNELNKSERKLKVPGPMGRRSTTWTP